MIVWRLRQRHVLFSPGHHFTGELPGVQCLGRRSIAVPPLPPEEIQRVQAFKAVQMTQLSVAVHLVPFGVDVGVATAAEGFAAAVEGAIIAVDHPDAPDEGVFVCPSTIEPFVFILDRRCLSATEVPRDLMALHTATVVQRE